jgi:hypothetical protein
MQYTMNRDQYIAALKQKIISYNERKPDFIQLLTRVADMSKERAAFLSWVFVSRKMAQVDRNVSYILAYLNRDWEKLEAYMKAAETEYETITFKCVDYNKLHEPYSPPCVHALENQLKMMEQNEKYFPSLALDDWRW